MPELIGQNEDILMDLELLKRYSQEKEVLSDNQKDSLKRLPKAKRKACEEEILKKQEREKKERLRIRTLELEDKIRRSDLPADITNEMLEMLAYAKERNMTFIYSVEKKIEALEIKIKEAEIKKAKEEEKQMQAIQDATMAGVAMVTGTAAVAGMALAPYVQVRYNKEEFEKLSEAYFEEKILSKLATASKKPIVPLEPTRIYKTKKGAMYPKSMLALDDKHEAEWMDILVKKVQEEQRAKKQKVQTREEIIASYKNCTPAEKRRTMTTLKKQNPDVAKRQDGETKDNDQVVLSKGIERLRHKHQKKEAKKMKALAKEQAKASPTTQQQKAKPQDRTAIGKGIEPLAQKKSEKEAKREKARQKMREQVALKKDRVQTKEPRVAERATNEKPVEVKEVSPATKQAELAPTKVKEEEKETSVRLTNKKEEPKGISATLMDAEKQKLQEAQNRVVAANKEKVNFAMQPIIPATDKQKKQVSQIVGNEASKSREFWLQAGKQNYYRETG